MKSNTLSLCALLVLFLFSTLTLSAQVSTPSAGLTTVGVIPVPNWSTRAGGAAWDLFSFNPATRILYQADSTNHGVIAVDTTTNTIHGILLPPNCNVPSCPSGVLVAPDLQKLIVTSRQTNLWIYDLETPNDLDAPGSPAAILTVPNGTDELDYDPVHQRVWVANTTAPYFLTGIDLAGPNAGTIVARIALPGAPEQPRFNPVNGFIYQTVPSAGVVVIDPNAGTAGTGAIVATYTARTDCGPQGNDIDPVTNTMLISCLSTFKGEELMNLADGTILTSWPNAQGTDVLKFNPNTRRWYTGSSGSPNGGICPNTAGPAAPAWPIVGVFSAAPVGNPASATALVGGQCSGRSSRVAGVDTIGNNIYVPTAQYPVDPTSTTTGQAGILVMNDPTATQPTPAGSQAVLGSNGTVTFTQQGRAMNAFANLQSLADTPTRLVVTTTVGNEVIPCNESNGQAICNGSPIGDPLIGGVVLLANGGKILSQGTIAAVPPLAVSAIALDMTSVKVGGSYNVTFSGSNLTSQTYFDIRVRAPGSAADNLVPNWQTGTSASHPASASTPTGIWTINGVRAHQDAADHTGSFVPVSTTITVTP